MRASHRAASYLLGLALVVFQPAGTLAQNEEAEPPSRSAAKFRMVVTDRFRIASGGIVVTGVIESGTISVGDSICILSEKAGEKVVTVTGIESFNKLLETASADDRVGLLVTGIELDAISVGDSLTSSCD